MNIKSAFNVAMILMCFLCSPAAFSIDKETIDVEATKTLRDLYGLNPEYKEMAEKAAGILIFPSVTKAGIGVAGEYGEGTLQIRGRNAGYFNIVSASVGLTAGVVNRREVIMFMTQNALNEFLKKEDWQVGVDASIALVYQGASDQLNIETDHEPVVGFIFGETGLMGDLSLEGSKITRIDE